MTSPRSNATRFFYILFLLAAVLLAMVIRPIASALFLAAALAGVLWPLQQRLSAWLRGRRSAAAGAFVFAVVVIIVGPLVGFSAFAIREGRAGMSFFSKTLRSEGVAGLVRRLPAPLQGSANWALSQLPEQPDDQPSEHEGGDSTANDKESTPPRRDQALADKIQDQVQARGGSAAIAVGSTLSAVGSLAFQTIMMVIALFFFLVQGHELVTWLDGVSPLRRGQTRELLAEFKKVSYAVIASAAITSGVQAATALLGYFIAGVPHPFFFVGVTFFVAFIPAIGAGSVCLAAALVLLLTGHPYAALFLALWGILVVGLVDNVVKPYLMKAGMEMRGAVVFFSLVGGLAAFGAVGLLLGPLVVSLFLALLRIHGRDFKDADEPR